MDVNKINREFERIYNENYDYIYKFLTVKVYERESAEDILQNVFLTFYQRMCEKEGEKIRDPRHYILKMAKRAVAEHYRSPGKQSCDINEVEIVDEKALDILENDDGYTFEEIMSGLSEADDLTFRIFILHFKYGCTLRKTAKELDLSESTVKSKMYRALKRIRQRYKEGDVYESI
ncbi:MAG: sigma-70 family RNA polymerase sigma factor [Ruminococcus sp.]|nr:sigma-70 family RNA polymerase sigma factor [Ruminococcus sp.]